MSDKLWNRASQPKKEENPYDILKRYARKLAEDQEDLFYGDVVQTVENGGLFLWSFYVVVPKLRNYSYRLFEVKQNSIKSLYPVTMRLFTVEPSNQVSLKDVTSSQFDEKLREFITSPVTEGILEMLKNQLDILMILTMIMIDNCSHLNYQTN